MSNEIQQADATAITRPQEVTALTPMEMLSVATTQGATPETIGKYMALQERYQREEARKAYAQAMVMFRAKCPTITKDAQGHTNTYATLSQTVEQIQELLGQCQLAVTWTTPMNKPDWIDVRCEVTHVMGHSESTTLGGAPDTGPGRNQLQARLSTTSYLRRYTLMMLLGLVSKDNVDDDGAGGAPTKESKPASQQAMTPDEEAVKRLAEVCKQLMGAKRKPGKDVLRNIFGQARTLAGSNDMEVVTDWLEAHGRITDGVVFVKDDGNVAEGQADGTDAAPVPTFPWLCTTCNVQFNGDTCPQCGTALDRVPNE